MRYDQPFCTIGSAKPFPYARNGYLPALEPREEVNTTIQEPEWTNRQWDVIEQLRLDQGHLRKQFAEMYKSKKKKTQEPF